jgi:hypothetical protein
MHPSLQNLFANSNLKHVSDECFPCYKYLKKNGSVKTFNIELLEYWEFAKISSSQIKFV